MASSQAASSFLYEETDDFIFQERSSVYQLRLERQRADGKGAGKASKQGSINLGDGGPISQYLSLRSQAAMSASDKGTSAMGNHDKKFTKVWERQETSPLEKEEERATFLDQLLQKRIHNGKEGTKSLLHRLVLLAKISPDLADKRDIAEYWEQLFVNLQRSYYQGEGITGLLLLYPACIVHILESSSDVLYSILRDLRDMEQQQRVLVLDAKILIMSHNLPSRLFQQWHYKVLSVPERHLGYDTSQEESAETLTHECLTALLKFGKHLLKYPKSPKNLPDTILEKVPELIVPQETICYLLACQELLSPAQYLQLFDSPVNIQMDSESIWPLSERLKVHFDWAAVKGASAI